jgi:hypothetical protein
MATLVSDEQKQALAGLWVLKQMDLGTREFPVIVSSDLAPLDDVLQQLAVDGHVDINRRKERYELSKQGLQYLGQTIDEAQALVDDLDELETADAIAEIRARKLDLMRARFLWGWYEGEFDDLVLFQQRRGVSAVETLWAYYLMSDAFWTELARDFTPQLAS